MMKSRWIIPAYAGSTPSPRAPTATVADHPRIRGEHDAPWRRPRGGGDGSSPHTRGAPYYLPNYWDGQGIIPAYAGSTRPLRRNLPHCPDHPRIRGEHTLSSTRPTGRSGSSPHTRGALMLAGRVGDRERIIPAYAGSTCRTPPASPTGRDHPRIRGEHQRRMAPGWRPSGSSPHTRGAR